MKPIKVLLVGNYLPDKQESMQRFAELMRRELEARGHKVRLIRPAARLNRSGAPPAGLAKWLGYIDKFLLFPASLRRAARRADIVHICDHSNAPYVKAIKNRPHIVTCNDMLAIRSALGFIPENPTGWSGKILQTTILGGLNNANHIACISENTRSELLESSSIDPGCTSTIYMGINYPYSPIDRLECIELLAPLFKLKAPEDSAIPPFIFHVGGNQWYKNRLGILKIFNELRILRGSSAMPVLVMAGKPFTDEMREFIPQNRLEDFVVEVQDCSNEELRAFYSSAQVMLFPSLAEGFGWPVVEAQACGCPVVTSSFAPLTEIGGEAAVYCDPRDHKEAAKELNNLLNEPDEARSVRIQSGLKNASRFTPQTMIEAYQDHYQQVLASKNA